MWADVYRIALVGANVVARVGCKYALGHIQWLVVTQHGAGKAAALHLCELVNQHIARGHNLAFKTQTAAEQKRLAKSSAIGEPGKVQLDGVNVSERNIAWIVRIGDFYAFLGIILACNALNSGASSY